MLRLLFPMKYILFLFIFLARLTLFSQSTFEEALIQYRVNYLPEKVFVHTDKNLYAAGETIWMALYLVDGQTHQASGFSAQTHVELLDAQHNSLHHLKLFTPLGSARGSIELAKDLPPGNYQLLAYTSYQRNSGEETLFRKSIRIVQRADVLESSSESREYVASIDSNQAKPEIRLRFFPEGGDCVTGLPCQVAVTAEDAQGLPVSATGLVIQEGEEGLFFSTNPQGMGQFYFTPLPGKSAIAELNIGDQTHIFDLPQALAAGYTLNVRKQAASIQLLLRTNLPAGLKGARLVVHHRGFLFIDNPLEVEKQALVLNIPIDSLQAGVHIVTLFDQGNQPVAERLFFIAPEPASTEIQIHTGQAEIRMREEVEVEFTLPKREELPDSLATAHMSMSVIPEVAGRGMEESDIRTWMLLNSDLDIPIPCAPELLFAKSTAERNYLVNLYLMTRGWRRFRWKVLFDISDFQPAFPLERGMYIRGQMKKQEAPKQARPGKVFLANFSHNLFMEKLTDDQGNFSVGPFYVFGKTDLILQGRYKAKRKKGANEEITLDDRPYVSFQLEEAANSPNFEALPICPLPLPEEELIADYVSLSTATLINEERYDSYDLDSITITASRRKTLSPAEQSRKDRSFLYGGNPTYRMVVDSVPGARNSFQVLDLFYRLPGVQVLGGQVQIRGPSSFLGSNSPTIFVDGMQVDMSFINSIPVTDVEFIDVLSGAEASIYGARGATGVILIYTRTGGGNVPITDAPGILPITIEGFHKSREFAVFDPLTAENPNRPDLRTTLHWNPNIEVDISGQIEETFTTSDQTGTYWIIVQGLRKDGQPLFGKSKFEVKEE